MAKQPQPVSKNGKVHPKRPGLKAGTHTEFTVVTPVIPGHAPAIRKALEEAKKDPRRNEAITQIGTLHESRFVLLNNDTQLMFCSSFDGDWDKYIDDFATTYIANIFDAVFTHCEGFPGITDPNVKDWFMTYTHEALVYNSAYPDATVKEIWKALKVQHAFQALLDEAST